MESCPSWSKEHDWKSCNRLKRFEGSNPLLSARNIGYSVCCTLYFFDKTARNSNPYNLLQDEVLPTEVYNIKTVNSTINNFIRQLKQHTLCHSMTPCPNIVFVIKYILLKIMFVGRYNIKPPAKILIIRRIIWSLYV